MRLLYGVVGDGMGHATRSRVVMEHLHKRGHEIHVVASDRAFAFLRDVFAGYRRVVVHEIHGLRFTYRGAGVDKSETLKRTLREIPAALKTNIRVHQELTSAFRPEMVFSDFESWAYAFGRFHRLPVVSIDNQQVIDRCRHPKDVTDGNCAGFVATRVAINVKLPRCFHYLATSFFFPAIARPRTTLVPPILRPEILAARRETGGHVLVYQTASTNKDLLPTLERLPFEFRVYGMGEAGREPDNVELKPFSQQGFIDDLRTARAVIAGGGFSLMCEAVHLRVPMLCVPLEGQWEQQLNARWLAKLGYGAWAPKLTESGIRAFLSRLNEHDAALAGYVPRDDAALFACVDELVERVLRGDKAPREPLWSPVPE
jgi:uncharacterized protein (TIGR00661 family)